MKRLLILLLFLSVVSGCAQNVAVTPGTGLSPQDSLALWHERNIYGRFEDYQFRNLTTEEKTDMILQVKSAEGIRYVWGGETPDSGLDCSGLIIWAYGTLGYKGFRKDENVVYDVTAHEMFTYDADSITAVADTRELLNYETGDLLFFDINSDGRIDHIAVFMYLDTETDTVWVWDASTNTGRVAYRGITNFLSKNPLIGKPVMLVRKESEQTTASK